MAKVIDTSELEAYADEMIKVAKSAPKHQKQFMVKEGNKLRTQTRRAAGTLGKKTGTYLKYIKRGKVYQYDGTEAVRVYSSAPHAHLIEDGHRMVDHNGNELGFVPGHHIFETAADQFEPKYLTDVDQFLDEEVVKPL